MRMIHIGTIFSFLILLLSIRRITKCKIMNNETSQMDTIKSIDQRIMDLLNSVSVGRSVVRKKNILNDMSNYIQFLKVLSTINPYEHMEEDGFVTIDTTGKKIKEKKNIQIVYSSRKNYYKNNMNDVKSEVNSVLYSPETNK
ncbi:hypothetical protein PGO_030960 [Plasmodium gonderi]|uniref:Variable surface protein n=1 Tax=Plasmodium gonderi TaxID=77519 RepID=A0A1Y1JEX7_PLAGO|nr:hypothetical protein PGO_030960 [Plasmodium gonderi]GAW79292.1 hypothetical protein PGO_030960 [Plasmodium gonderi]